MKLKSFFVVTIGLLLGLPVSAQRQQVSENYNPPTGLPMPGKRTYSYIIGEDGKNLKDGSFSITAKPEALTYRKGYVSYKLSSNGHYKVNTTFRKGLLNGAFNFSYNITATAQDMRGGSQTDKMTVNYIGNFADGLPHGSFNIVYGTEYTIKLKAQYNRGVLVGAYSCTCIEDGLPVIANGTLSSTGDLVGRWTIQDINGHTTYEFQNGVLIRKSNDRNGSTKPSVTEWAKKYAAGAITEEELFEHNILVLESSISLGSYAKQVALWHDEVLDFESIGGYDFSEPNDKTYKYLEEVTCFNDKGFDFYTQKLDEQLEKGEYSSYIGGNSSGLGIISSSNGCIVVEDAYLEVCTPYIKAVGNEHPWDTRIYLTKEQARIWEEKIHEYKKLHALDFCRCAAFDRNVESYFKNPERVFTYLHYKEIRENAAKEIEYGVINKALNSLIFVPNESDYLVEKDGFGREYNPFGGDSFIKKESIERDTMMLYILAGKYEELIKDKTEEEKSRINNLKRAFDEKYEKDLESNLTPFVKIIEVNIYGPLIEFIEGNNKVYSLMDYLVMKNAAIWVIKNMAPEISVIGGGQYCEYENQIFKEEELGLIYVIAGKCDEFINNVGEENRTWVEELKKSFNRKVVNDLKEPVEPILEKLLNQSASFIAYTDDIEKYFSPTGLPEEYWRLEFARKLKPFGKIIGYEIVDFYGEAYDEVECILTTLGKKKTQNKYRVIWKLDIGSSKPKIQANSIDINSATLMTEADNKDTEAKKKVEKERLAKEAEAARIAKEQAETERLAQEKAARIAEEKAQAEAKRLAEAARIAKEQAETERLAQEETARIAEEKAKAEAERLAEAEAVRIAKEQTKAERLAQKEAARLANEKKQTAETSTFISQNAVDNDKPSQKISKAAKELKTRSVEYEQYIEMSLRFDGFDLNYIGGYRLNPHLFAGVGTGVDYFSPNIAPDDYYHSPYVYDSDCYHEYPDRATIPLYANFRVNFTKKSWSPYVSLLAGCRFSTTSRGEEKVIAPICSVHLGMNKIIKNDKALYLGIGMDIETEYIYECKPYYGTSHIIDVSTETYGAISVIMGLSF